MSYCAGREVRHKTRLKWHLNSNYLLKIIRLPFFLKYAREKTSRDVNRIEYKRIVFPYDKCSYKKVNMHLMIQSKQMKSWLISVLCCWPNPYKICKQVQLKQAYGLCVPSWHYDWEISLGDLSLYLSVWQITPLKLSQIGFDSMQILS